MPGPIATRPKLLYRGRGVGEAGFSSELLPGRQVLLFYRDDPGIWHVALLLWPAANGHWWIMTPDNDVYVEDVLCKEGEGPSRCVLCDVLRRVPQGLGGATYRFAEAVSDGMLTTYMETLAEDQPEIAHPAFWYSATGEKQSAEKTEPVKKASKGDKENALAVFNLATPDPKKKGKDITDLTGGSWYMMEETAEHSRLAEVEADEDDLIRGRRGLRKVKGKWATIGYFTEEELEEMKLEEDSSDNRILEPVFYDDSGMRALPFAEAVAKMREEPIAAFPLKSARSLMWLMRYTRDHGGSFDGRQSKWAAEQKIDTDSTAYVMHDLLGAALDLAATWDQLDMANCASMELVGRIYQMIEETRGSMTTEGLEHFIGRDPTAGVRRGVALAPALAEDAMSRQSKEVEILKQRRKAREEKALAGNKGQAGQKK